MLWQNYLANVGDTQSLILILIKVFIMNNCLIYILVSRRNDIRLFIIRSFNITELIVDKNKNLET